MNDIVAGVFGIGISLLFKLVPSLSTWYYQNLKQEYRGLFMIGLGAVLCGLVFGANCIGLYNNAPCTLDSGKELLRAFFVFVMSNLATYKVTPESKYKLAS